MNHEVHEVHEVRPDWFGTEKIHFVYFVNFVVREVF